MSSYDVLVVGAGIGGLCAAARLSKLGHQVAVFEHHVRPGGYATNFPRPGKYEFDVSLHAMGSLNEGEICYEIFSKCGIMNRITPVTKEHPYTVVWEGKKITIPQNPEDYLALLQDLFPQEKESLTQLFADLYAFNKEMQFLQDASIPKLEKQEQSLIKAPLFIQWSQMTTAEVMKQYVKDEELISFFTLLWPYYGLPPQKLSAHYFFVPWLGYHLEGTYYIKGGAQAIADALTAVIQEHGGKVYLRHEVTEIIVADGRATGIKTKKGEIFEGKWIISNASPHMTFSKLMREEEIDTSYREGYEKLEIGPSVTQLYLGLKEDPAKYHLVDEDIVFVKEKDPSKDYQYLKNGDYQKANFGITNYYKLDPELSPNGKPVIVTAFIDFIENWPEDKAAYKKRKEEVTQYLLSQLEAHYPGITRSIEVLELGTPRTMQKYTKNPAGAVYGFAQTVEQSGLHRLARKTPLDQLSLVGAWTRPGGGYQGAAASGASEAEKIHKKLSHLIGK
ncbi:NAD(P)/FAD-dependent oxidoreductase [Hazenella sp. IB182357]|uniref:NAD(P)/FAD-dependent oxidoreductase n=2 Tax=Polycladospora coralii TaxID=2771432 RepID=A0A926N9P1_9BACL|nr:NAD(P)/FAD-dependent oxidoreductase [Polycladospora coralii]MBD1372756.1 NAD(P)/FAD-dependent oxidoreductase [Polycladospora coralii]MBS7531148.1 NAD(P)/FAD-dependent oxidoreductase [Polycladospora coralii]